MPVSAVILERFQVRQPQHGIVGTRTRLCIYGARLALP
jgi:hypothetical protein